MSSNRIIIITLLIFSAQFMLEVTGQQGPPGGKGLELDDLVENVLLFGGYGYDNTKDWTIVHVIRSDGILCNHTIPDAPKVFRGSSAAVYVPSAGAVILCAAELNADAANPAVKIECWIMSPDRAYLGLISMGERSQIVLSGKLNSAVLAHKAVAERVKMVVNDGSEGRELFLYSNAINGLIKGIIQDDKTCPADRDEPCSGLFVTWERTNADFGSSSSSKGVLNRDPCLAFFKKHLLVMGGLDQAGSPVRTAFLLNLNDFVVEKADHLLLPSPPRAYHACLVHDDELYLAGGIQHPPTLDVAKSQYRFHAGDFHEAGGVDQRWTRRGNMVLERADFGLVAVRSGRKADVKFMAVAGIVKPDPDDTSEKRSFPLVTNSIEFYDENGDFWYKREDDDDDSSFFNELPPIAHFAHAVVPTTFTPRDTTCDCIPDASTGTCYQRIEIQPGGG